MQRAAAPRLAEAIAAAYEKGIDFGEAVAVSPESKIARPPMPERLTETICCLCAATHALGEATALS